MFLKRGIIFVHILVIINLCYGGIPHMDHSTGLSSVEYQSTESQLPRPIISKSEKSDSSKAVDSSEYDTAIDSKLREVLELMKGDVNKVEAVSDYSKVADGLSKEIQDKVLFNEVLNLMQMSRNNADVITQAFRFVRLDAHLTTLLSQLAQLSGSQESLQTEAIKQQSKFNVVLDEIRALAEKVSKESIRLTEVEERLESEMELMSDRLDTVVEKIIQSAASTQILLDLSKDNIQQADKCVGISDEVLTELKSVRTELADVGQASVQTIYNVQKLEESLLTALEETENRTYAMRHQYLVDEVSLVPLGNRSMGNFMQADGTILTQQTLDPGEPSPTPSTQAEKPEKRNGMQDTSGRNGKRSGTSRTTNVRKNTGKPALEEGRVSPCTSSHERMSPGRPRNCEEIQIMGQTTSGVYRIYPNDMDNGTEVLQVYCDLVTDGGGWTVIQRRKEPLLGKEDFEKTWQEYSSGFGILHDSHWIGLDTISELTKTGDFLLRVQLTDWEGEERTANYGYFRVASASEQFKLFVTDYSGDAGDSLAYHNGMAFTTKDRDNDLEKNVNCAEKYHGAFWFKSCHQANLNGLYVENTNGKHVTYANGINWYSWHGYYYSLKRTEMKIRSRHFHLVR